MGRHLQEFSALGSVPVVFADLCNTSRQCSECWHTHRTNRVSRAWFACRSCGAVMHADHNGSRDIAHRGEAAWQRGAANRPSTVKVQDAGQTPQPAVDRTCKPRASARGS